MDTLQWLTETEFGKCIFTMLVSMVPIIELRGGLPFGVALGLPFPAGAPLEKLAETASEAHPLMVWSREGELSLSGPCTQTLRAIEKGEDPAALALGVEQAIGKALARTISWVCEKEQLSQVLLAGGVSANREIRRQLEDFLGQRQIGLWAPDPRYSVDGAVGNAWAALLRERQEEP